MIDHPLRLAIAKLRAAQIIRLVDLCLPDAPTHPPGGMTALRHGLTEIRHEAQAIVDDREAP